MATTHSEQERDRDARTIWGISLHAIAAKPGFVTLGALLGATLGITVAFILPATYTARATFIPPANNTGPASLIASQLGALTGTGSSFGAAKDPNAIYLGILSSRTLSDNIIAQFGLQKIYKHQKLSQAEKALAGHVKVMETKDGMVDVDVQDHDAKRAADIANAMLKELIKQNDRLALTEASQRRKYFENQLLSEKDALANAEVALVEAEENTGIIHPTWQAQVQIQSIAQTRAQISERQIQLALLAQSETSDNPDIIRLHAEIEALQTQLNHLEAGSGGQHDRVLAPASKTPALTQEYLRKQRDLKFHESLFELLLRQYENAKLDEARNAPLIQIVDQAVVPDTKSGPPRKLLILGFALIGLAFSSALTSCRAVATSYLAETPNPEPPLWAKLVRMAAGRLPDRSTDPKLNGSVQ